MPADRSAIGRVLAPVTVTVETGQLLLFAKATGETRPAYTAGERPLVPPTFLFGLEMRQSDPFAWLADIGVDLRQVLHGEQASTYHSLARAGDTLVARPQISDIFAKKGGALEFIVKKTQVTRTDGSPVADLTSVLIARAAPATTIHCTSTAMRPGRQGTTTCSPTGCGRWLTSASS